MSQQKTQPRYWTVRLAADEDGYPLWDDLEQRIRNECERLADIVFRLGGKCYIEPKREQDDSGLWHTVGCDFVWDSFVPGSRKPKARTNMPTVNGSEDGQVEMGDLIPLAPEAEEPVAA